MELERLDKDWGDNGYHEVTRQPYQGFLFYFGRIGACTAMLNDKLDPHSGKGYHSIDLVNCKAYIGATEYSFTEHLNYKSPSKIKQVVDNEGVLCIYSDLELQQEIDKRRKENPVNIKDYETSDGITWTKRT